MNPLPQLLTTSSCPLTRILSTPSPSSSNSSSSFSSGFDSPRYDLLSIRRSSEPPADGERRQSAGSMTSYSSSEEGVFKPPDFPRSNSEGRQSNSPLVSGSHATSTTHSPHEVTTPNSDCDLNYFSARNGNVSPASSATSTAHSKGEATPRAEMPAPVWPLIASSPSKGRKQNADMADVDMDDSFGAERAHLLKTESMLRRKHASLDASTPHLASAFGVPGLLQHSSTQGPAQTPSTSFAAALDPSRRASDSFTNSASDQRVIAQSNATGCRISAPISPPAHYPGSAKQSGRKASPTGLFGENTTSDSNSISSSGSSSSNSTVFSNGKTAPPAPRWAHPPRYTNKISGRAWSFSQGQERPEIDFDPELFDTAEPDAVQEILKGMEGRIAVKTTPTEYNIMAWLPGFSIDDITISMKGDRTVQIVADLWDEGDHAQWNVLLGEDVNKSAISATFKGAELRVTVKRNPPPFSRSYRSTSTSWSAPARVVDASVSSQLGGKQNSPTLATYPRTTQVSH